MTKVALILCSLIYLYKRLTVCFQSSSSRNLTRAFIPAACLILESFFRASTPSSTMSGFQPSLDSFEVIINRMSAAVVVCVSSDDISSREVSKAHADLLDILKALVWHYKRLANVSKMLAQQLLTPHERQVVVNHNMPMVDFVRSWDTIRTNLVGIGTAMYSMVDIVAGMKDVPSTVSSTRILSLSLWTNLIKRQWNIIATEMVRHPQSEQLLRINWVPAMVYSNAYHSLSAVCIIPWDTVHCQILRPIA